MCCVCDVCCVYCVCDACVCVGWGMWEALISSLRFYISFLAISVIFLNNNENFVKIKTEEITEEGAEGEAEEEEAEKGEEEQGEEEDS